MTSLLYELKNQIPEAENMGLVVQGLWQVSDASYRVQTYSYTMNNLFESQVQHDGYSLKHCIIYFKLGKKTLSILTAKMIIMIAIGVKINLTMVISKQYVY